MPRVTLIAETSVKSSKMQQSYLSVLLFFVVLVSALLHWRLLHLLGVLEEQRVSQPRAKENVAWLHGDHLARGERGGGVGKKTAKGGGI